MFGDSNPFPWSWQKAAGTVVSLLSAVLNSWPEENSSEIACGRKQDQDQGVPRESFVVCLCWLRFVFSNTKIGKDQDTVTTTHGIPPRQQFTIHIGFLGQILVQGVPPCIDQLFVYMCQASWDKKLIINRVVGKIFGSPCISPVVLSRDLGWRNY